MTRVGIYGGTFDPVHIGHLIAAENALRALDLDQVRFIPAYQPPHKSGRSENANERLEMLELALSDHPKFVSDDREILSEEKNYSLYTVTDIIDEFCCDPLYYIMGEDSLMSIDTWHRWRELLALVEVVVIRRPGTQGDFFGKVEELRKEGYIIHVLDDFPIEISSSKIRELLAKGETIRYVLPDAVMKYIRRNRLYEEE